MEAARGLSAEDAAHAIHSSMERASRNTVRMLLGSMTHYTPQEGEFPQAYLLRLSQSLILEFLASEFAAGRLPPWLFAPRCRSSPTCWLRRRLSRAARLATFLFTSRHLGQRRFPRATTGALLAGASATRKVGGDARPGNLVRADRRNSPDAAATCGCGRGCAAPRSSYDPAELCAAGSSTLILPRAALCGWAWRTDSGAGIPVAEPIAGRVEPRHHDRAGKRDGARNQRVAGLVPGNVGPDCFDARRFCRLRKYSAESGTRAARCRTRTHDRAWPSVW